MLFWNKVIYHIGYGHSDLPSSKGSTFRPLDKSTNLYSN